MWTSLLLTAVLGTAGASEAPPANEPATSEPVESWQGGAGGGAWGGAGEPWSLPPRLRLGLWHATAGGTALGISASSLELWDAQGGFIIGGIVLGGLSPLVYKPGQALGHGEVSAIITSEQLLAWNLGTAAGLLTLDSEATALGILGGLVLGGGLGMGGVLFPAHDADRMAWTRSGMFGGLGVAALALSLSYQWNDWPQAEWLVPLALVVGGDLGAVAGQILQPRLDLDRGQARALNIGALLGGGLFFLVPLTTQDAIIWLPHEVALFTTAGVLGGGAAGLALNERIGRIQQVSLNGPMPSVGIDRDGKARLQVTLLSGTF